MRSESAGFEFVDVGGSVDAENVVIGGGSRRDDVGGGGNAFGEERIADEAVFLRREDVGAEVQVVTVVIDERRRGHGGHDKLSHSETPQNAKSKAGVGRPALQK